MSLLTKDSLMSLRDVALEGLSHRSPQSPSFVTDEESNDDDDDAFLNRRKRSKLPLQDLQERVAAKRRRLSLSSSTCSALSSSYLGKKTVSFDMLQNQISKRHLSDTDLSNAWLTPHDFRCIKKSCSLDIVAFRLGLLTRNHTIRGLEHRALPAAMIKERARRNKSFRTLLLEQQDHYRMLAASGDSHNDMEDGLCALSQALTAPDREEAVQVGACDAKELLVDARMQDSLRNRALATTESADHPLASSI